MSDAGAESVIPAKRRRGIPAAPLTGLHVDSDAAEAALAAAIQTSRQAITRGTAPRWFGIVWSICMGAIYWLWALPDPLHLIATLLTIATQLTALVVFRRTVLVQANGFTQPRTLWVPALMVVVMIGAYLGVGEIPRPPGVQWQWIVAGIVMTAVGGALWWLYNTVFRRAQLRQR